jgi:hypothetical protein
MSQRFQNIPLTWEQSVYILMSRLVPNKDMVKKIVREGSVLFHHKKYSNMVNIVLSRPEIKACDLCYKPCCVDKSIRIKRHKKTKRRLGRYGTYYLCCIRKQHQRWFEIICDVCISKGKKAQNLDVRIPMFAMGHPLLHQLGGYQNCGIIYATLEEVNEGTFWTDPIYEN